MAEKEVYLGVRVKSRPPTHRMLSGVFRHPSAVEHARLLPDVERITETLALPGLEGRLATTAELGWLLRRSAGLELPTPTGLSSAVNDVWEPDDLISFADRVEYDVAPLGRTVHVSGRGSSHLVERHVAARSPPSWSWSSSLPPWRSPCSGDPALSAPAPTSQLDSAASSRWSPWTRGRSTTPVDHEPRTGSQE